MGVENMNIYKEISYLLCEILFAFLIIIFGYYVWDSFDTSLYNTAKNYDNLKEVQIVYQSNYYEEDKINNTILSLHNVSNKKNNKDIVLKINKSNNLNNVKIYINSLEYNLDSLFLFNENEYNYYVIENVEFDGYETKTYYLEFKDVILLKDYEFLTELYK